MKITTYLVLRGYSGGMCVTLFIFVVVIQSIVAQTCSFRCRLSERTLLWRKWRNWGKSIWKVITWEQVYIIMFATIQQKSYMEQECFQCFFTTRNKTTYRFEASTIDLTIFTDNAINDWEILLFKRASFYRIHEFYTKIRYIKIDKKAAWRPSVETLVFPMCFRLPLIECKTYYW